MKNPSIKLSPTSALNAIRDPFSVHTEAVCALRQELLLRRATGRVSHQLVIISPGKGEGKSRLAAELAWLFSQLGEATLLVDANLRAPSQQLIFSGGERESGLAEALANGSPAPIHQVEAAPKLSVVLAGKPPQQPVELLAGKGFGQALEGWREQFEHIIFDTPAFAASSDAMAVAIEAGSALLLVREQFSRVEDLRSAASRLRSARVNVLGTVSAGF